MIDELLARVLGAFFVDDHNSRRLIWEDSHSAAPTFSGRGKLALALGLISSDELRACDAIRAARNIFAHEWETTLNNATFKEKLSRACKILYDLYGSSLYNWRDDELDFLIRHIFIGACGRVGALLANRVVEAESERRGARLR